MIIWSILHLINIGLSVMLALTLTLPCLRVDLDLKLLYLLTILLYPIILHIPKARCTSRHRFPETVVL